MFPGGPSPLSPAATTPLLLLRSAGARLRIARRRRGHRGRLRAVRVLDRLASPLQALSAALLPLSTALATFALALHVLAGGLLALAVLLDPFASALLALAGALERLALLDLALLDQLGAALLFGLALRFHLATHRLELLAPVLLALAAGLFAFAAALATLAPPFEAAFAIGARRCRRQQRRGNDARHPVHRLHGPLPGVWVLPQVGTTSERGGKRR